MRSTRWSREYQKTHPNFEVEWINITGGGQYGRDKLQTMLAGGDAPDMMMLNTGQFEGLACRGVLLRAGRFGHRRTSPIWASTGRRASTASNTTAKCTACRAI